jgi:hypothetical protein
MRPTLHRLHARTLLITGVAAIGYGLIELVEGVGLWLDRLWAEYLTVIATSVLIPVEAYELVRKPTLLKAGGIAVNVAIVAYLAWMLQRRLAHHAAENPPNRSGSRRMRSRRTGRPRRRASARGRARDSRTRPGQGSADAARR